MLRDYFQSDEETFNLLHEGSVSNSGFFNAIYFLDRHGVTRIIGLDPERQLRRNDFLSLDLSRLRLPS